MAHLAQLNVGRLVAETGDPRVAAFMAALERVNALGKRMPGFVWMMEGSGAPGIGNTETKIGGDPRFVANLTVWENAEALEQFVWNTVHRQFYARRRAWFEALEEMHFVMWRVPQGHRPSLEEGLERLAHLEAHGDSDHAFGWAYAREARLWRMRASRGGGGVRRMAEHVDNGVLRLLRERRADAAHETTGRRPDRLTDTIRAIEARIDRLEMPR